MNLKWVESDLGIWVGIWFARQLAGLYYRPFAIFYGTCTCVRYFHTCMHFSLYILIFGYFSRHSDILGPIKTYCVLSYTTTGMCTSISTHKTVTAAHSQNCPSTPLQSPPPPEPYPNWQTPLTHSIPPQNVALSHPSPIHIQSSTLLVGLHLWLRPRKRLHSRTPCNHSLMIKLLLGEITKVRYLGYSFVFNKAIWTRSWKKDRIVSKVEALNQFLRGSYVPLILFSFLPWALAFLVWPHL